VFRAYRLLLLIFCQVLNRGDIFGFVNSGIVDRPLAFLILIIDLDETPIPLNLITLAASLWPTRARTRGSFRITSNTGTFSTPSSTSNPARFEKLWR
jgi:hypothetical protein